MNLGTAKYSDLLLYLGGAGGRLLLRDSGYTLRGLLEEFEELGYIFKFKYVRYLTN